MNEPIGRLVKHVFASMKNLGSIPRFCFFSIFYLQIQCKADLDVYHVPSSLDHQTPTNGDPTPQACLCMMNPQDTSHMGSCATTMGLLNMQTL